MPKISIVIPIYNVEKFLPRCLESVLRQTFTDYEVICVNDGSPDKCLDILVQYSQKDSRIIIVNPKNQGLSMARNNGIKLAKGEYIYFLDPDDAIHPQCLETILFVAQKHNSDLVCFQFENYYINTSDELSFFYKKIDSQSLDVISPDQPLEYVLTKNTYRIHYNVWTKFYKKSLLQGIEFIPDIQFEDYPHTFDVLLRCPRISILKEALYLYTNNPDSISNKKGNLKQIVSYHIGILHVCNAFRKTNNNNFEKVFLKKKFIPDILKQQLYKCRNADGGVKAAMYEELWQEIKELYDDGLLYFCDRRVIKSILYCYFAI